MNLCPFSVFFRTQGLNYAFISRSPSVEIFQRGFLNTNAAFGIALKILKCKLFHEPRECSGRRKVVLLSDFDANFQFLIHSSCSVLFSLHWKQNVVFFDRNSTLIRL